MTCPGATEPTLECYVGGLIYPSVEVEPPLSEDQTGGVWIVYGSMTEGMSEDVGGEVFDFYVQDGRSAAASPQLDHSGERHKPMADKFRLFCLRVLWLYF